MNCLTRFLLLCVLVGVPALVFGQVSQQCVQVVQPTSGAGLSSVDSDPISAKLTEPHAFGQIFKFANKQLLHNITVVTNFPSGHRFSAQLARWDDDTLQVAEVFWAGDFQFDASTAGSKPFLFDLKIDQYGSAQSGVVVSNDFYYIFLIQSKTAATSGTLPLITQASTSVPDPKLNVYVTFSNFLTGKIWERRHSLLNTQLRWTYAGCTFANNDPPVFLAGNYSLVHAAENRDGAPVHWNQIFASDPHYGLIPAVCSPASDSNFQLTPFCQEDLLPVVTCTATNIDGLSAEPLNFTVCVIDDIPPYVDPATVKFVLDDVYEATSPAGARVDFALLYHDNVDDDYWQTPEPSLVACYDSDGKQWYVNDTFALGDEFLTCVYDDTSGNAAFPVTLSFRVVDTTPPSVDHSDIFNEADTVGGSYVNFADTLDLSDNWELPSNILYTCKPASGSLFAVGSTAVHCNASDSNGNSAASDFSVTITDTTPPTLSGAEDISVPATSASGATVFWGLSTSDIYDGADDSEITCDNTNGGTYAPSSTTTVSCYVTDSNGNQGNTVTFKITVGPWDSYCPDMPKLQNGAWSPATNVAATQTSTLTCDAGYKSSNNQYTDTCEDADLNPSTPPVWAFDPTGVTCVELLCLNLVNPTGGSYAVPSNALTTVATLTCNTNYYAPSETTKTCTQTSFDPPTAKWVGTATCKIATCPSHSVNYGSWSVSSLNCGTTTTLKCNSGYYVNPGVATVTCTQTSAGSSSGTWSGSPTCTKMCKFYSSYKNLPTGYAAVQPTGTINTASDGTIPYCKYSGYIIPGAKCALATAVGYKVSGYSYGVFGCSNGVIVKPASSPVKV